MSKNQINDGGPAMPSRGGMCFYIDAKYKAQVIEAVEQLNSQYAGLSLRDYFAATIINGLLSDQRDGSAWTTWNHTEMATEAYLRADAMLAAREL